MPVFSWSSVVAIANSVYVFLTHALVPATIGWPIVVVIWYMAGVAALHIAKHRKTTRSETKLITGSSQVVKANPTNSLATTTSDSKSTEGSNSQNLAVSNQIEPSAESYRNSQLGRLIASAPQSVLCRYVDLLLSQRDNPRPDMPSLLDTAAQPYTDELSYSRNAPNLLMLVGLVGTILGLAAVVSALGPQILSAANSSSPQDLARAISPQIRNLGTAFVCTLHGLIAAILVARSNNREEVRQNQVIAGVEVFCLQYVAPKIFPKSIEAQLERVSEVLRSSNDFTQQVAETMNTAANAMADQVKAFGATTTEASQSLGQFLTIARYAAGKLDASIEKLDSSITAMSDLQRELHGVYTALMQRHEDSEQKFKERVEEIVRAVTGLQQGFNVNSTAIVQQLQKAATNYELSTTDFRTASGNFVNMSKVIGAEAYQAIAETAQEFHGALIEHRKAIDLVESSLREVMARLDPALLPKTEWDRVLSALTQVADSQHEVSSKVTSILESNRSKRSTEIPSVRREDGR